MEFNLGFIGLTNTLLRINKSSVLKQRC